jgi:hypothetical protein
MLVEASLTSPAHIGNSGENKCDNGESKSTNMNKKRALESQSFGPGIHSFSKVTPKKFF